MDLSRLLARERGFVDDNLLLYPEAFIHCSDHGGSLRYFSFRCLVAEARFLLQMGSRKEAETQGKLTLYIDFPKDGFLAFKGTKTPRYEDFSSARSRKTPI